MRRPLSALFALCLGLATLWFNGQRPHSELFRFGWEYGNLAAALAQGRGFADAMLPGSGPSAWMPPVLPLLYALVFKLCGIKSLASCVVLACLRCLAGGACLYWTLGWLTGRRAQLTAFLLAVVATLLDWPHQLADLNDVWWTQIWLCLALQLALRPSSPAWPAAVLPLASPAAGLAMLAGLVPELLGRNRRAWLVLAWAAAGGLGWGLRNQLVLGHPYPIKSNLWFEFQLANQVDDDGVITLSTIDTAHPIKPNTVQQEYLLLGEARFLEKIQLRVDLPTWGRKTLRRCRNSFLDLAWEVDEAPALGLSPAELAEAGRRGLLVYKEVGPVWLSLDQPIRQEPAARIQARQQRGLSWGDFLWTYWFSLLPALAALRLLRRRPRLVVCYLAFLSPYLLIQHYARYQVSSLYVQILLEVLALEREPRESPET